MTFNMRAFNKLETVTEEQSGTSCCCLETELSPADPPPDECSETQVVFGNMIKYYRRTMSTKVATTCSYNM